MLEGKDFVAGNAVTVADFQLIAEDFNVLYIQLDQAANMPNIVNWRKRMMEIKAVKEMHDENSKFIKEVVPFF